MKDTPEEKIRFETKVGNRTYYGNKAIVSKLESVRVRSALRERLVEALVGGGFPPHLVRNVQVRRHGRFLEFKYKEGSELPSAKQ